ncbi:hypothetical protein MRB53_035037 [Persea americana]|uniref:Uncharacterized protein n=1 Tax=Persea americana TaxID=3435 RepID=A0ACC2K3K2_PERAE|nr:hypothetical protein MRB53_035037 [Persea americana]
MPIEERLHTHTNRKRSTALLLFPASPYYVFCKDTAKKKKKKVEAFSDPTSIFFLFDFLEQQSANPRHGFCSPSLVIQNPYLAFPCHPSLLELETRLRHVLIREASTYRFLQGRRKRDDDGSSQQR